MLDSDMNLFFKFSLLDLFLNDNTNGSWVNIEDLSSSTVIEFVRHAFVDGSINNNVNIVSLLVFFEIVAHSDSSVSSESLLELMLGS